MDPSFYEFFPEYTPPSGGEGTVIKAVRIFEKERRMEIDAYDPSGSVPPIWVVRAEQSLQSFYGQSNVALRLKQEKKASPKAGQNNGKPLFGKPHDTREPESLREVSRREGKAVVHGQVIAMTDELRERFRGDVTLWFDITDNTGAIRVSRNMKMEHARELFEKIKPVYKDKGWVSVSGKVESYLRGDTEEWILRPDSICHVVKPPREDTGEHKRVELHLHTQMSLKDATCSAADVITTAARWGHPAVAITDHGVCHSFPDAMNTAEKMRKSGTPVKVIYGCEAYMPGEGKRNYHIILLVKNETGLKNLYTLVSQSHTKYFHGRPRIPKDVLKEYREGLIIGSACEAGELFRAIVKGAPREELLDCASFYDYLEIQPICNNRFLVREGLASGEEHLREFNREVVKIGEELGLPVCATGDVHFLEPEHEIHRRVLLEQMNMNGPDPLPLYFKTTQEMLEEFSYLGDEKAYETVVANPNSIALMCEDIKPVRSGEFPPRIEGSAEELSKLSVTTAHELYGETLPPILAERMDVELGSIIKKGYDIIYIVSQRLVQRSISEGYLVGSRGSVGSSIVAYLSGITEVNALPPHYRCPNCKSWEFPEDLSASCGPDSPDKDCPVCGSAYVKDGFDIPFATFLGFEADKKPDIDLNFSGEYQERAHMHTVEIFGEDKVFRAGTITTLQEKTAYGWAKKFFEPQEATQAELGWAGSGCVGVKTTSGQHPGGLIVVPDDKDIYDFCPVQYPADKTDGGRMITTHFDYHAIEENLLKLDLLGHDDPTMIRMLEDLTGVNARDIPLDDEETMSLFVTSKALGFENDKVLGPTGAVAVPEFGTRFVRGMLQATKPTTFDELVRISGLSHGTDVWLGNAEVLVSKGIATLRELICCRDDIMLYLIGKGVERKLAFTIMESVRKGKGLTGEWETAMRNAQVPEWYIDSCKKIQYMFPKAHAVAYVQMAFRIAWFKVHRPLEFYAAFFSIRATQFDAEVCTRGIDIVKNRMNDIEKNKEATDAEKNQMTTLEVCYEFYKRGFSFAPIDIYTSHATKFLPRGGLLSPPLAAIGGLGGVAAESITAEREKGRFLSAEDLLARCKVNKNHVEALKTLGALGDMPDSTQTSLF